jgi:hypothetical protein
MSTPDPPKRSLAGLWGALIGLAVGLGLGIPSYLLLTPALEASSGLLREMQGFAWNLVPGTAVVGALLGALIGRRMSRHPLS